METTISNQNCKNLKPTISLVVNNDSPTKQRSLAYQLHILGNKISELPNEKIRSEYMALWNKHMLDHLGDFLSFK